MFDFRETGKRETSTGGHPHTPPQGPSPQPSRVQDEAPTAESHSQNASVCFLYI